MVNARVQEVQHYWRNLNRGKHWSAFTTVDEICWETKHPYYRGVEQLRTIRNLLRSNHFDIREVSVDGLLNRTF